MCGLFQSGSMLSVASAQRPYGGGGSDGSSWPIKEIVGMLKACTTVPRDQGAEAGHSGRYVAVDAFRDSRWGS